MHTNINRSAKHALFLKTDDLKILWDLVADNYGKIKATFSCIDGSELHTDKFSDLEGYDNPSFRKISHIKIRSVSSYKEPSCTISIGEELFSTASISITDDSDDRRALKVADEFKKRIQECRPFYWIARYCKPTLVFLVGLTITCSVMTWSLFIKTGWQVPSSNVSALAILYIVLPLVGLGLILGSYVDRAWAWMFPNVWIDLGRQVSEYRRRVSVRHWVFGVMVLSIILSIIANLITNLITN